MVADWISDEGEGVSLRLRVIPNASRDIAEGIETAADGRAHLKIRVRAIPDKGAANTSVLKLLAKSLRVPKSAIELVSGQAARLKTVRVSGMTRQQVEALLLPPTG